MSRLCIIVRSGGLLRLLQRATFSARRNISFTGLQPNAVPGRHTSSAEKAQELVMSTGGDFELVFTVRPEELEAARSACALTVIGEVVEEGIWMEQGGQRRRMEARGYEHRIGETK
ncbi:MAG: hypothetical protein PHY05_05695 [Methanothrix sp.]|nr:hypothetical protein [Methanothrix sp.]